MKFFRRGRAAAAAAPPKQDGPLSGGPLRVDADPDGADAARKEAAGAVKQMGEVIAALVAVKHAAANLQEIGNDDDDGALKAAGIELANLVNDAKPRAEMARQHAEHATAALHRAYKEAAAQNRRNEERRDADAWLRSVEGDL